MTRVTVENSMAINAPASKVWRVFTDPALTRQMGGEHATDWKVGSSFGWKSLDGQLLTTGTILKLEPEKMFQHELLNSVRSINSIITYKLDEKDGVTTLRGREDFAEPISEEEYGEAMEAWNVALQSIKELVEK